MTSIYPGLACVFALVGTHVAPTDGVVPPPRGSVTWDAPAACPSPRDVQERIEERLGRSLAPDELQMHGTISLEGDVFVLRLEVATLGGPRESRELRAAACTTLAEAAALLGALSVDAVRTATTLLETREIEAPAEPARVPEEPPAPIEDAIARPVDRPAPRKPARFAAPEIALGLEGGLAINVAPGLSGAVGARVHWLWRAWALQLGGQYVTPQTAARDEGRVRVRLGSTDVRGCGLVRGLRWALPLCAGLEIGAMRGDGRGVDNPRTQHGLWLAGLVSIGWWGWVSPRVGLGLRMDATAAAVRPQFELRNPGPERGFRPATSVATMRSHRMFSSTTSTATTFACFPRATTPNQRAGNPAVKWSGSRPAPAPRV